MIEIRNVRFNARKGRTYASVYQNGELICGATLDYCKNRAEGLAKAEAEAANACCGLPRRM